MDAMAPYIMAQSALFEPDLEDQLWLCQQDNDNPNKVTATILRCVIKEHNDSTSPTRHAVIFLMELRPDLENQHFSSYIRHEPMSTTRDIEAEMLLSEDFLQNITNVHGRFQRAVLLC